MALLYRRGSRGFVYKMRVWIKERNTQDSCSAVAVQECGAHVSQLAIHSFCCRKVLLLPLVSSPQANELLAPNSSFCLDWYTDAKNMGGWRLMFVSKCSPAKLIIFHWTFLYDCMFFKIVSKQVEHFLSLFEFQALGVVWLSVRLSWLV